MIQTDLLWMDCVTACIVIIFSRGFNLLETFWKQHLFILPRFIQPTIFETLEVRGRSFFCQLISCISMNISVLHVVVRVEYTHTIKYYYYPCFAISFSLFSDLTLSHDGFLSPEEHAKEVEQLVTAEHMYR